MYHHFIEKFTCPTSHSWEVMGSGTGSQVCRPPVSTFITNTTIAEQMCRKQVPKSARQNAQSGWLSGMGLSILPFVLLYLHN